MLIFVGEKILSLGSKIKFNAKRLINKRSFFALFLILGFLLTNFFTLPADASFSLERRHQENKAKIKRLKWLESIESNKLYRNQRKLEQNESYLQNSKMRYTSTQMRLGQLEAEYKKAQREYELNTAQSAKRINLIYRQQRAGLLNAILSTTDVNTLSDYIYYNNIIMKRDKAKVEQSKKMSKNLAALKSKIETERDILNRSIMEINQQQKSIKRAIDENSSMIEKLRNDRAYYERAEKELARQSSSLGEMIKKTSSSNIKVSSGFMKPINGPITSPFGWRIHPIFKSRTFHTGVDIGGPYNGAVKAANSGKVIFVNWYGGYGKVVIIDHGTINGSKVTTLYAHLNSYAVAVGNNVQKGQVIGREGTTGYSTGPHVHFEVRINGKPTNPLNYI